MKKEETFYHKNLRVYKELNALLASSQKITKLTDDQRIVLLTDRAESKNKHFNFPAASDHSAWDKIISPDTLRAGFEHALQQAIKWAEDNQLIDVSYGIGEGCHMSIMVVGFEPASDQKLIIDYEKSYMAQQKEKERDKKLAQQTKKEKFVMIGKKKYKLVETK